MKQPPRPCSRTPSLAGPHWGLIRRGPNLPPLAPFPTWHSSWGCHSCESTEGHPKAVTPQDFLAVQRPDWCAQQIPNGEARNCPKMHSLQSWRVPKGTLLLAGDLALSLGLPQCPPALLLWAERPGTDDSRVELFLQRARGSFREALRVHSASPPGGEKEMSLSVSADARSDPAPPAAQQQNWMLLAGRHCLVHVRAAASGMQFPFLAAQHPQSWHPCPFPHCSGQTSANPGKAACRQVHLLC